MEELAGCTFPRDAYYFLESFLWLSEIGVGRLRVGVLQVTQTLWGKIVSIRPKPAGSTVEAGRSICFVESRRFMGHLAAPFSLRIDEVNRAVAENPALLQRPPREDNWLCSVSPLEGGYADRLMSWEEARSVLEEMISSRGIVCFDEPPDYVYAALGIDCSQLLMVLSDKIEEYPRGALIHVVADYNQGAERDLEKWGEITGNEVLGYRVMGRIIHALVRSSPHRRAEK